MKTKTEKNFCYEGLGFPVVLDKVQMVEYDGEWHPKIDVKKIAEQVIRKLPEQRTPLTGTQVKFIRSYFSMSLRDFGNKVVHESHAAVRKWEKKGGQPTAMNQNTEQVLRLFLIEQLFTRNKTQQEKFYSYFKKSRAFCDANSGAYADGPIHIPA